MKTIILKLIILFIFSHAVPVRAEQPWWPHPIWGAEDQAGASNWISSKKIMQSLSQVKSGKVYELGFVYESGMPLIGSRSYQLTLPKTQGPIGKEGLLVHEEKLETEIGHVGTQLDGLGHFGQTIMLPGGEVKQAFYNGFEVGEIYNKDGLTRLGIEHIKPIISRGILIDIAGYKGVDTLPDAYQVTLKDVKMALKKQGIDEKNIKPGDTVFLNFGWWRVVADKSRYVTYEKWPGINQEVAAWLIDKKIALLGSDAIGDLPGQWHVHLTMMMKNGIHNLEFMIFDSVLQDSVYEFLFIFTPIRFRGATGSPGRPLAIH